MPGIIGSLVLVFKCGTWRLSWCMFWLGYEMRLDCLLLHYLQSLYQLCWQASKGLSLPFPLCFGASFLLMQRWKLVLVCSAGGGVSCMLAPGQQLSHICLHVDEEWLQERFSSFLAMYWNLKCAKVSMRVRRHSLCMIPINTIIFLLIQLFLFVMKFYLQLQLKRVLRQHNFFFLSLSFSPSGGTSSLVKIYKSV